MCNISDKDIINTFNEVLDDTYNKFELWNHTSLHHIINIIVLKPTMREKALIVFKKYVDWRNEHENNNNIYSNNDINVTYKLLTNAYYT